MTGRKGSVVFSSGRIEQRQRELSAEIQKLGMQDPMYAEVWAALNPDGDFDSHRVHMYVNLVVNSWALEYDLGMIEDAHLLTIATGVFKSDGGRRYWPVSRPIRETQARTRRERRFLSILEEAYSAANPVQPADPEPAGSPA